MKTDVVLGFFAALVLVVVVISLRLPKVQAQDPLETVIATTLESLRETPDLLKSRIETLQNRLERKRTHLTMLNERLSIAFDETNEEVRDYWVSHYSYQVFLVTSRIAAEEDKLIQAETLMALIPVLDTNEAPALIKKELEEAVHRRIETLERLLQEAEEYRPLITEPMYQAQFEKLEASIRSDWEHLNEQIKEQQ